MGIVRMIRQYFGRRFELSARKVLEEPHQSPGIVSCGCTRVGAFEVRFFFHGTRTVEGIQTADRSHRERSRDRRPEQNRCRNCPLGNRPVLFHQCYGVVVEQVRSFVTQGAGKLLGVLDEVEQRVDHVDVSAGGCERVRLLLMNDVEVNRVRVLRLNGFRYSGRDRLECQIQGRRGYDFALLLELRE